MQLTLHCRFPRAPPHPYQFVYGINDSLTDHSNPQSCQDFVDNTTYRSCHGDTPMAMAAFVRLLMPSASSVSQCGLIQLAGQVQLYESTSLLQVPPFSHGLLQQGS